MYKKKPHAYISCLQNAVDLGGPRREFFTLVLRQIQENYFDPVREYSDNYEIVGKILGKRLHVLTKVRGMYDSRQKFLNLCIEKAYTELFLPHVYFCPSLHILAFSFARFEFT